MADNPTISQAAKINIDSSKKKTINYYDFACEARNIKHFMGKATIANGTSSGTIVTNAPYNNEDRAYEYRIDPASISSSKQVMFYFENLANTKESKKKYALFFFNLQCSTADTIFPLYFFMLNNDNSEHILFLEVPTMSMGNANPIQLALSYKLSGANLALELIRVDDDNVYPTTLNNYTLSNMRLTYNIF